MEINWKKLGEIIKTQPFVGYTDSGLGRAIGASRMVINNWQAGERDLPFLQKARMLDFAGYQEELSQMLSILPKDKQLILRKKLRTLSVSWKAYVELNYPGPTPYPPFGELILQDDEVVELPDGPSRAMLDKFGFPLSLEAVKEKKSKA